VLADDAISGRLIMWQFGEQGFSPPYPVAGRDSAARQPSQL